MPRDRSSSALRDRISWRVGRGADLLPDFSALKTARSLPALIGSRGRAAAALGGAEQPLSHPAFDRALAQSGSRVLRRTRDRLPADWRSHFGPDALVARSALDRKSVV